MLDINNKIDYLLNSLNEQNVPSDFAFCKTKIAKDVDIFRLKNWIKKTEVALEFTTKEIQYFLLIIV